MAFLGFGKRKVIDLSERYKREQEKIAEMKKEGQPKQRASKYENSISSDAISLFANRMAKEQIQKEEDSEDEEDESSSEDKKKKLAKRLMYMTDRIEDLSNQIYHLQQRVEVLEKKLNKNLGS